MINAAEILLKCGVEGVTILGDPQSYEDVKAQVGSDMPTILLWDEAVSKLAATSLIARVSSVAETVRTIAAGHAGHLKVAGWNAKVDRATRIIGGVGTSDDLRIIGAEAAIKGRSREEQAQKIIDAAAEFGELNGYVEGFESELIKLVQAGQLDVVAGFADQAEETLGEQTIETIGAWVSNAVQILAAALGRELG